MGQSAKVTSIEALEDFKVAFVRFRTDAGNALGTVDQEVRRILDSLDERAKYWQRQVREWQDEIVRAKSELLRRKSMGEHGRGPGFTEQEEALDEAQRRLAYAEEKVEACRRWSHVVPHAVTEYEGPARQLSGILDTEVRHAIALLESKLAALEAYVMLPTPPATPPPEERPEP